MPSLRYSRKIGIHIHTKTQKQVKRYRLVSAAAVTAPKAEQIATAETLSSIDEILKASEGSAPFVFVPSKELSDKLHEILVSLSLSVETLNSGALVNRAIGRKENGISYRFRVWNGVGRENVLPAKEFTKEEIGKAVFGFCKSDGQTITETITDAMTGAVKNRPVMYLSLA